MFLLHGYPKIIGGAEKWEMIGAAMRNIHINFAPAFWGLWRHLRSLVAHWLNSRVLFRPALAMLIFTMFIAAFMHYTNGDGFGGYSRSRERHCIFGFIYCREW